MIKQFKVVQDHDNMRVDRWLRKNKYKIPQGLIEKLLRNGKIKINDKKVKSSFKVKTNDKVKIFNLNINANLKNEYAPSNQIIKSSEDTIIFNCSNYIVINKKSGTPVQGGTKSRNNLVDIFSKSKYFPDSNPYTVHRIDKDTSGILIIAKNRKTAQLFTSLFRLRRIHKTYIALCHGEIKNKKGLWDHNIEKKEKNKIITEKGVTKFKVLDKNSKLTLIEMKPITGRKHQLRKQTSFLGHPIYGDNKYGYNRNDHKKLFLHAYSIKFIMDGKKLNFTAPIPEYFREYLIKKKIKPPDI